MSKFQLLTSGVPVKQDLVIAGIFTQKLFLLCLFFLSSLRDMLSCGLVFPLPLLSSVAAIQFLI